MYVVIPAQTQSTRVPLKNIRPFYKDESLLSLKLKQLKKFFHPNRIYVSSEDQRVEEIVKAHDCNFMPRPMSLTGNDILQGDLISNMLEQLPQDQEDVMWVQVTQPLFDAFDDMINCWEKVKDEGYDGIVAVKTLRHHVVSAGGIPINFNFGCWHKVSQKLPKFYEILWAAFIQTRKSFNLTKYHISRNPYFQVFDHIPTVDIDTIEDFESAQALYAKRLGEK